MLSEVEEREREDGKGEQRQDQIVKMKRVNWKTRRKERKKGGMDERKELNDKWKNGR